MMYCSLYTWLTYYFLILFYQQVSDRKTELDPGKAAKRFKKDILSQYTTRKLLNLVMDTEDRDRTILSFYKTAHVD